MAKEMVNHPAYYNHKGRKECIVEMEEIFGTELTAIWALITAYKYRYRCGAKDAVEQEKAKIKWYEDYFKTHVNISMNAALEVGANYAEIFADSDLI